MKKYELPLKFYDPVRIQNYLFIETTDKNPKGDILFEGLPKRGRGYLLHYTEDTLLKLQAKLTA